MRFLLMVLLVFPYSMIYCQKTTGLTISNIDFRLIDDHVIIKYDIIDSLDNGKYFIEMQVYNSQKEVVEAKSTNGDVNKIVEKGENKIIFWEIKNDYPDFNDSISITLTAIKYIKGNVGKKLLVSTLYPGLEQYKQNRKKSFLLLGGAGYGLLGTSLIFEKLAMNDYNKYKNLESLEERDIYFEKAQKRREISNITLYSGIAFWLINYGLILYNHSADDGKLLLKKQTKLTFNFDLLDQPAMALKYSINF